MESVFIEIDGLPVPFFISDYRQKNNDELILTIDDINTEEQARELVNCKVWLATDQLQNTATEKQPVIDDLIGYEVVDENHGALGILEAIDDSSQNPLLRVLNGKTEILIPLQAEFILEINDAQKTILVNTPEGLIDLY